MKPRRLLVHSGGVGDFLCTLPALAQWQPGAHIEVAGIPERASLAQRAGLAEAVHDLERIGFHTAFSTPNETLRQFARRFESAWICLDDSDGVVTKNLIDAGIVEVHCFPGVPPEGWEQHAAHWYAKALGVSVSLPACVDFGPADEGFDVVIAPGSGGAAKNWPIENFESVARQFESEGHHVRWCGGPAESEWTLPSPQLPTLPLVELAPRLARSRLFIGNDSGITHLAAVSGCPTVAIFGPTDPAVWRPMGPQVTVLQGKPWPPCKAVLQAARQLHGTSSFPTRGCR